MDNNCNIPDLVQVTSDVENDVNETNNKQLAKLKKLWLFFNNRYLLF